MTMNRKELIREYKERAQPMGVFRVAGGGVAFIGSSKDLPAALNGQRARLKFNSHPDKALQAVWNRLGPDAFIFETLDTLELGDAPDPALELKALEALWREKLASERGEVSVDV